MGGNKKSWWLPVIIILISTGLTILGTDLTLRLFGKKLMYYRPNEMFLDRWPNLPLVSRYKPNAFYEGETYGDLAAMQNDMDLREKRRVVFKTDAYGFRNSDNSRNDDAYDAIILGDSFGVGLGTTQNRTWVAQLRERYGLRTYNLSIPGGSPWQSYVIFASEVKRLPVHPGSVVLVTVFSGNDLDDYYYTAQATLSELPWNNAGEALGVRLASFVKRSPILQLLNRLRHGNSSATKVLVKTIPSGRSMLFFAPYAARKDRTAAAVREHANYPLLLKALRDIKRVAAANGMVTEVVLFPSKEEVYAWVLEGRQPWDQEGRQGGLGTALESSCREGHMRFVDLKPYLVAAAKSVWADSGDVIYWTDDTHWNEKGHGIVADAIHEVLANRAKNDIGAVPVR